MALDAARDASALPFRFRTPVMVRFRDLDALGHVNNAVYFTYFEIARTAYFEAVHDRPYRVDEFALVIAEASCRYRSPVLFGQALMVEVATVGIRSRSFELRYRLVVAGDERLAAEGRTIQFAFDHQAGRTITLPRGFRAEVEALEGRSIGRGVDA